MTSLQIRLNSKIEEITGSKDEDEMMAVRALSLSPLSFSFRLFKFRRTGIRNGHGSKSEDDEGCIE